jgi:hypothetical protein
MARQGSAFAQGVCLLGLQLAFACGHSGPEQVPSVEVPPIVPGAGEVRSEGRAVPLLGGTVTVLRDGRTAVASDPDRDRLYVVDLDAFALLHDVALEDGDEPFRIVEAEDGVVWVSLRGTGAAEGGSVVRLDTRTRELGAHQRVCRSPQGVAWDGARSSVVVACSTGTLVRLAATGEVQAQRIERADLRDVVVVGDQLLVTHHRSAEMTWLDAGTLAELASARPPALTTPTQFSPRVALRTSVLDDGRVVTHHQRAADRELTVAYYPPPDIDQSAGGVVHGVLTQARFAAAADGGAPVAESFAVLPAGYLPDVAVSADGKSFAALSPIADSSDADEPARALAIPRTRLFVGPLDGANVEAHLQTWDSRLLDGQASAVTFRPNGDVVVQFREPARLEVFGAVPGRVELSNDSRLDSGHLLFHTNTAFSVACASCHPEGGDDGHVWHFAEGKRRSMDLRGGFLDTAPFHWTGVHENLGSLLGDTFVERMGGLEPSELQTTLLGEWLNGLPRAAPKEVASDLVERGRVAFEAAGCSSCHAGSRMTDNRVHDVGTGGVFQTPSLLGLSSRLPLMHDGCAVTIAARFDPACGGAQHSVRGVDPHGGDLDALVAFLESL